MILDKAMLLPPGVPGLQPSGVNLTGTAGVFLLTDPTGNGSIGGAPTVQMNHGAIVIEKNTDGVHYVYFNDGFVFQTDALLPIGNITMDNEYIVDTAD